MKIKSYAGIDIGSNAARLIIKDLHPTVKNTYMLKKRVYIRLPLRIGLDVFSEGSVSEEKTFQFIKAMEIFKDIIEYNNVLLFRACATSAVRNAENKDDVLRKIKLIAKIDIDVIDGHEEANLLYLTNREKLEKRKYYISADLGGGSLQIGLFRYSELIWANAFKTGTLRFITNTIKQSEIEALESKVTELKNKYPEAQLMGSGGNINKIAKMIGKSKLSYNDLEYLYIKLTSVSFDERIKKYSLREDRADVILPALETYMRLIEISECKYVIVPKTGLADGIIRDLFLKEYGIKKLKL
jgi:exopolyphosphatase/guanosine-5'-triphosphate,3'-diphosphate pyrophosphatase